MARATSNSKEKIVAEQSEDKLSFCGFVRPITPVEGYLASHWNDVHEIVAEATLRAGYQLRLVSDSDSAGIIVANIIENLYNDPIVICDVSARNPNVFFELGMRLSFEKPVIIITDDETPFTFDISPIKHIVYPKTLRFNMISEFKVKLTSAIKSTVEVSQQAGYRGYLQQFGPIEVTQLGTHQVDLSELASDIIEIKRNIGNIVSNAASPARSIANKPYIYGLSAEVNSDHVEKIYSRLAKGDGIADVRIVSIGTQKSRVDFAFQPPRTGISREDVRKNVVEAVLAVDDGAIFRASSPITKDIINKLGYSCE